MNSKKPHIPVMLDEVLHQLNVQDGSCILDMTVGAGGHFEQIQQRIGKQGSMVGVDKDPMCIENIQRKFPQYTYYQGGWTHALEEMGAEIKNVNGVLIDCGVSSMQLDQADRGFSFRFDAPLDMRMDTTQVQTARDLLHQTEENELADILYQYADEHRSRKIAKSIVQSRRTNQLETTFDLAQAVTDAVGPKRGKIHPATKTFQAIRIKLNQELKELEQALKYLIKHLPTQARIVVISFHSIEDRLVKNIFRDAYKNKKVKRLHKKAIQAGINEIKSNPRARSAKVRAIEVM